MKTGISIADILLKRKIKHARHEDRLIDEAYSILNRDLFHEKKVLSNLTLYNRSFEQIDEDDADVLDVFAEKDIKEICIAYRLRFIDSQFYKKEIPYAAILKIKDLNVKYRKNLKGFKIMAPIESFRSDAEDKELLLFAPTNNGNYCLIYKWGAPLNKNRAWLYWPMRRFETLMITVLVISAILAFSLPTRLIWLPEHSPWWGMYRLGALLHIFIFNLGFTAYLTFAFSNNLSASSWNSSNDNR